MSKKLFEISQQNKMLLVMYFDPDINFKFQKKCNIAKEIGLEFQRLRRNNQWVRLYDIFNSMETDMKNFLAVPFIMDKGLEYWIENVRTLLPKVQQAKLDCQNHSWDWLTIQF